MPMSRRRTLTRALRAAHARLADEAGFTMFAALLVLVVSTILVGAMFLAVGGDVHVSQHDLDGKRAYTAAEAGANAFLYQLNQNPNYWQGCSNDALAKTQVPNTSPPESYSYKAIPANGNTSCTSNAVGSLIDNNTGSLRMEFSGYSGSNNVNRTIVAQYRKLTPLDFAWYTVFESIDSAINGYTTCGVFYRAGRDPNCNINWVSGDTVNGPMYTQDQYLINGSPTFGRNSGDKIESLAPGTRAADICSGSACGGLNVKGTAVWSAPFVPLPSDNTQLLTDATNYGKVFAGTTTIVLGSPDSTHATVTNCPSTCSASVQVDLTAFPVIYVTNAGSCNPPAYSYTVNSYSNSGCAGDVYVKGNYTTSATIAAANNIIINGNLTTTESGGLPTGTASLGLVANQYIRVQHACSGTPSVPNLKIDAAILALKHSFIVDNFDCGSTLGTLTVNGAIVQDYRGAVGTSDGGGNVVTGYVKNYNYDDRLAYLLPPYLFDISTGGWEVARETLCTPGGGSPTTAC